jgi:AcrR family transcriptional regulator
MAAPGGAAVVRHQDGVRPGDDIAVRRHAGDPVEDLRGALTAARERFTAQGYVATTTEQIAERAGVSQPTVFASAVDL